MKHIGFTGTRYGMTDVQKNAFRTFLYYLKHHYKELTLHHGDCIGADADAHEIAQEVGCKIHIHPGHSAKNQTDLSNGANCQGADKIHKSKTHFARNRDIVDASSEIIAAPKDNIEKGGTWYTINYAKKNYKSTVILHDDLLRKNKEARY